MSMKIKVSYTEDAEASSILALLKPILDRYKVKKSDGKSPYKHIYLMPKNGEKP